MFGEDVSRLHFLEADTGYDDATHVIVGFPLDQTSSFRPGARFAPNAIRQASNNLEEYDIDLGETLSDLSICDLGDLNISSRPVADAVNSISHVIKHLLADRKFPVSLGGEHLISLPVISEMARVYPDLAVIHFDAHLDLRSEYEGRTLSHATVMHHVQKLLKDRGLAQFGIRSGSMSEHDLAKEHGTIHPATPEGLQAAISRFAARPLYVTFDLDCLDPSVAPGVTTPEPGGMPLADVMDLLDLIPGESLKGLDVVELCPPYDHAEITAFTAAKIVRKLILIQAGSK
jgi:agmatinase